MDLWIRGWRDASGIGAGGDGAEATRRRARRRLVICVAGIAAAVIAGEARAANRAPRAPLSPELSAALARSLHAIEVIEPGRLYRARSSGAGIRAIFTAAGPNFRTTSPDADESSFGLRVRAWGCGDSLAAVPEPTLDAEGTRIDYRRGDHTEWYENGPRGVEQGFTLAETVCLSGGAENLAVEMDVVGATSVRASGSDGAVVLNSDGRAVARLADVRAIDAHGRRLPARFEPGDGKTRLRIRVDASSAVFPVSIDPLIAAPEKRIGSPEPIDGDVFGSSVSIDGETLVVGQPMGLGQAVVYVRNPGLVWAKQATLLPADLVGTKNFGASVSVSGDTIAVGAPQDDGAGASAGATYVFTRTGSVWTEQAKLVGGDTSAGDDVGRSVAVDGNTLLIGASAHDHGAGADGAAYVFTRTGSVWSQQGELLAGDASGSDGFGAAAALDGDTALIGAGDHDHAAIDSGAAYVFTRSGSVWSFQSELTPLDAAASDHLGSAVALRGDRAAVGAPLDDSGGIDTGSAYLFDRSGSIWSEDEEVFASDGGVGAFAASLALGDDVLLAGKPSDADAGANAGALYLFRESAGTFVEESKLVAHDAEAGALFGTAAALFGEAAVVGAPSSNPGRGATYVFRTSDAQLEDAEVLASDAAAFDSFGISLAMSGDTAILGAPFDDGEGSAYVFLRTAGVWAEQAKLKAPTPMLNDLFGYSVSIDGDRAAIGAPRSGTECPGDPGGSVHFFTRSGSTWTPQQQIQPAASGPCDQFGWSVALEHDGLIVGTPESIGSATAFHDNGASFSEQAVITLPGGLPLDFFGYAVALDRETAIVGMSRVTGPGAAHVYVRIGSKWHQQAVLTAPGALAADGFGSAVSISGDTAVIGAVFDETAGNEAGAAYVFVRSMASWAFEGQLIPLGTGTGDRIGAAVDVDGDVAVVGGGGLPLGRVFVRSAGVWTEERRLAATDSGPGDWFGFTIAPLAAVARATVMAGAPIHDHPTQDEGAAYVYELSTCGDLQVGVGEECDDGGVSPGDGCSAECQLEACDDGTDNDGDGLTDLDDPGCTDSLDVSERDRDLRCDDGIDNDADGWTDHIPDADADGIGEFPGDPACAEPDSNFEGRQCQDGLNNDGDFGIDYDGGASRNGGVPLGLPDPQCLARPWRNCEKTSCAVSCGLGGELILILPPLAYARRRLRSRRR